MKKNISHTEKESRCFFDRCPENLEELLQNNRFFKQIRRNLVRKKYEKYFEEIGD